VKVAIHVDQLWFSVPGGIGTYVRQLPPALRDQDPALQLVAFHSRWAGPAPDPPRWLEDCMVVEIPAAIRTLYPSWDLVGRPALPAAVGDVDVVHATNHAAVPPATTGRRLVVTVHDLAVERFPEAFPRAWRWLYRAGLRAAVHRADALLVPSRHTADDLIAHGADGSRVHVTPLAASLAVRDGDPAEVLTRLRVPAPYVLFVGTLEPRKNLVRLVRAYRRAVGASDLPHALVLAGPSGWGTGALLHELARGGPGRIVRTGPLSPEDLDALYRSADAFAYPSLYEGFGLPVVEAMSRGVPTVAAMASSLPEVTGDAALLVDPADEDAIATALRRILTVPALAGELRARGLERSSRFSWAATARATLDAYAGVAGES
jgi:glycosyltransferase involved in cell wall biosynthesis